MSCMLKSLAHQIASLLNISEGSEHHAKIIKIFFMMHQTLVKVIFIKDKQCTVYVVNLYSILSVKQYRMQTDTGCRYQNAFEIPI